MAKEAEIRLKSIPIAKNQKQCIDAAKLNPTGSKGVLQFYNSDYTKSNLRFGELEIHSVPIIKDSKQNIAYLECKRYRESKGSVL